MKRTIDVVFAVVAGAVLAFPALAAAILVRSTSRGPVLYWSDRVGRHSRTFRMPKFRTMRIDTPELPTDCLRNPTQYLTPVGSLLRTSSLDEIPQLWSILVGDMSLVGPRPALRSQEMLNRMRRESGVDRLRPGLTGWAQVNGRDDLSDERKLAFDREYLDRAGVGFDLRILALTVLRVARRDGVAH